MDPIRLGVAYYPEHDPEHEWDVDAALMRELGLDTIRIGEFCWSRMQRPDGTLTLDWLDRVVETFARRGIQTILCTPTATPPVWVVERFPDLAPLLPDGRRGLFGGRRHYSAFHEGYRELCVGIASALAQRFGRHEAVAGWYIDNEVGSYSLIDCSPPALRAFQAWAQRKHGTIDQLNRAWGLIFWNQELERFDQIPAPTHMMCTRNPAYLLDYNRFALQGLAEFILIQARAIREHARDGQFVMSSGEEHVTHALHRAQSACGVRFVSHGSVNNYPELLPGPGQNAMRLDRHRAINAPMDFFIPEQQIGSGYTTTGGLPHEIRRLWAWEGLARGGRMICWFHWRRFRSGCEWRLTSVIERDRRKRGNFQSLARIVAEVRRHEALLRDARVAADAQVLYPMDNTLAFDQSSEPLFWMEIQLPEGAAHRFGLWEKLVRRAVYNPLSRLGLTLGFVTEEQEWSPAKPLIVVGLDMCDDALLAKLVDYCERGGTLIVYPGVGERDEHGCHREMPSPGNLGPLLGVELEDYYPVQERGGSTFDQAAGRMTRPEGELERVTTATIEIGQRRYEADVRHGEVLAATDAEVIGRYVGRACDGRPAITRRALGRGSAIYLGAAPMDGPQACELYRALLPELAREEVGYRCVKLDADGRRCELLFNDSPDACPLTLPVDDVLTGQRFDELTPYAVVLRQV